MVKKIGNILILLLFVGKVAAESSVSLSVENSDGYRLKQAQVGVPFVVVVTVTGNVKDLPQPTVAGIDTLSTAGNNQMVSMSTRIINGVATYSKKQKFVVVASQEGEYTVGPARIEEEGNSKESSSAKVTVAAQEVSDQIQESTDAFVKIDFDKKIVYTGESVTLSLRFYYSNDQIRISGVAEPQCDWGKLSALQGPVSGSAELNGRPYRYLEWTAKVYPEKEGDMVISPILAQYSAPRKNEGRRSDFEFFDFFGGGRQERKTYSNQLKIKVIPLPEHTPPVKAVGIITSVNAALNSDSAGEGEGVILTVSVTGREIEQLQHPTLQLPENLTSYESNVRSEQGANSLTKNFEYVIQGLALGDYTIPAQELTYFDLEKKEYKTVVTDPLLLTITGVAKKSAVQEESVMPQDVTLTIIPSGQWNFTKAHTLSWLLFFLIFSIPFLVALFFFIQKKYTAYKLLIEPEMRYQNAFKNARTALNQARAKNYNGRIYHIFVELFSDRKRVAREQVTEFLMEKTLRDAGVQEQELVQWRILCGHLAESAFSPHRELGKNDMVFNKALHWIHEWEKIL